jgi:hypothetical protein
MNHEFVKGGKYSKGPVRAEGREPLKILEILHFPLSTPSSRPSSRISLFVSHFLPPKALVYPQTREPGMDVVALFAMVSHDEI